MENKIKNTALTLALIIFLAFSVSALDTTRPGKVNEEYTIVQTCSTCSYVNISVSNINGILFDNKQMTNNGSGTWIYKFTPTEIGTHDITGIGDINGEDSTFAYNFDVNSSGQKDTSGFYFLILILSIGVMIFGFYLRDPIIVILSSFGLYFVGLYILFFGIDGMKDPVYTWAIGIIVLMIAAYVSVRSAYELIVD